MALRISLVVFLAGISISSCSTQSNEVSTNSTSIQAGGFDEPPDSIPNCSSHDCQIGETIDYQCPDGSYVPSSRCEWTQAIGDDGFVCWKRSWRRVDVVCPGDEEDDDDKKGQSITRGNFHVLPNPVRVHDSRDRNRPLKSGTSVIVRVAGAAGIPSSATGVVLNVTAVASNAQGFLSVSGPSSKVGRSSSLNFSAGATVPAMVVSNVSRSGYVQVYAGMGVPSGSVHFIIDALGYLTANGGVALKAVTPTRIVDTRNTGIAQPGTVLRIPLPLASLAGVTQILANVTTTDSFGDGIISAGPNVGSNSVLNFQAGRAVANATMLTVSDGAVTVSVGGAATHVIVDVEGVSSAGGSPIELFGTPRRMMDTRSTGPMAPYETRTIFPQTSIPVSGGASALLANVTVTDTTDIGVYAIGSGSVLNWVPGETRANMALIPSNADGSFTITNSSPGMSNLIVDVMGGVSRFAP